MEPLLLYTEIHQNHIHISTHLIHNKHVAVPVGDGSCSSASMDGGDGGPGGAADI